MIIITGQLVIREGCIEDAIKLSLKHVKHSRTEPGCISHDVTQGIEDTHRLFFFEQWQDQSAVDQHFSLDTSLQFVKNISSLCTQAPSLRIYEATQRK